MRPQLERISSRSDLVAPPRSPLKTRSDSFTALATGSLSFTTVPTSQHVTSGTNSRSFIVKTSDIFSTLKKRHRLGSRCTLVHFDQE